MFNPDKFIEDLKRILDEQAEAMIEQLLENSRAALVMGRTAALAFFCSLVLGLDAVYNRPGVTTAATDGLRLFIASKFFAALDPDERLFVLAHEAFHVALDHVPRCLAFPLSQRKRANYAADMVVNPYCRDAGLKAPKGLVWPSSYGFAEGLSLEEYFKLLPDSLDGCEDGDGGDGGDGGEFLPAPADELADAIPGSARIQQAANCAKGRGDLPGALGKFIEEALKPPKRDWREVLKEYLTAILRMDSDWSRPSRRSEAVGAYLPDQRSEQTGYIAVHCDTSGSTWHYLAAFGSEMQGMLAAFPVDATVMWGDTEVKRFKDFTRGDIAFDATKEEFAGGGGTNHTHVFDWLAKRGLRPDVLVCLTDLDTTFPDTVPDFPVIWVSTRKGDVPFGVVIEL